MNLDLAALTEQARAGTLHELELLSLEGGVYLLRARLSEGWQLLRDARGESLRLRSTTHLRELLRELPAPPPCVLLQQVVHDEMCGVRSGPIAPLRIPLNLAQPW